MSIVTLENVHNISDILFIYSEVHYMHLYSK